MSVLSDVAQEVADVLNAAVTAGTFSPWVFAANRTYSPPRNLEDIQDLEVLVLAAGETKTAAARGKDAFLVTVQVAVIQKVDMLQLETSNSEMDALMDLVQSIGDKLRAPLPTSAAGWQASRRAPIYDAEALLKNGVFQAVTEVDYLVVRDVP